MSINLDVRSYCHECPEFEADVEKVVGRDIFDKIHGVGVTIRCKHKEKCENIYKHIESEKEK